jgi:hypothetical protein
VERARGFEAERHALGVGDRDRHHRGCRAAVALAAAAAILLAATTTPSRRGHQGGQVALH